MAIAFVQSASGATTSTSATSVAATFSKTTQAGNTVLVAFAGGTLTLSGVADTVNTYTKAVSDVTYSDVEIWYCSKIAGGTALTVTASFTAQAGTIFIYEFSGLQTSSALDRTVVAHGNGSTASFPTATLPQPLRSNELIFSVCNVYLGAGTDLPLAGVLYKNFLSTNSTPTSGSTVSAGANSQIINSKQVQTVNFGLAYATATWELAAASFKGLGGDRHSLSTMGVGV